MKFSVEPTGKILISASSQVEHDNCTAVIVTIDDDFISSLKTRARMIAPMIEADDAFHAASFFGNGPDEWVILEDDLAEEMSKAMDENGYRWVWVDDVQEDDWYSPDNTVKNLSIDLNKDGNFLFKGYGKHTGDDFETDEVDIYTFLESMPKPVTEPEVKLKAGFCIIVDLVFGEHEIGCKDEQEAPVIFATEQEAKKEIADHLISELQAFIDGHISEDNANFSTDEYVAKIDTVDGKYVIHSMEGELLMEIDIEPEIAE